MLHGQNLAHKVLLTCRIANTLKPVFTEWGTQPELSILPETPMEKKNCKVPHTRSKMKMTGMRSRRVSTWTTRGSIAVFLT